MDEGAAAAELELNERERAELYAANLGGSDEAIAAAADDGRWGVHLHGASGVLYVSRKCRGTLSVLA